jgi:hypothetical protein
MTLYKRTKINKKVQYLPINSMLKYKNKNNKQNKRWKNKKKEKKNVIVPMESMWGNLLWIYKV